MQIQEKITVKASPEEVWALISDPRNAPRFNRMVQEVTDVRERQGGVGTTWRAIAQMAGRMEIANEITEWEPPHRLAIKMAGPASGTLSFTLTPQSADATVVEQHATSNMPAISAPLVRPMLEQNLKESLQKIKEQVEQS